MFNKLFQKLTKLITVHSRPPSVSLKKEMAATSMIWRRSMIIVFLSIPPMYISALWFMSKRRALLFTLIKIYAFNQPLLNSIYISLAFGFFVPHSTFFAFSPMFLCVYSNTQVKFLLKILLESMERLQMFEDDFNNLSKCIDSSLYQELIRNEMTYFLVHYIRIKK